jgi:hypothetical protein
MHAEKYVDETNNLLPYVQIGSEKVVSLLLAKDYGPLLYRLQNGSGKSAVVLGSSESSVDNLKCLFFILLDKLLLLRKAYVSLG